MCVLGCPPPHVYKGGRGRPAGPRGRAQGGGVLLGLLVLVGFLHKEERGKEGEGEGVGKGALPPFPCPIGLQGGRGLPWLPSSLSNKAHGGPLVPPGGGPVTPPALRFYPKQSGTLPVSK